ncbi:MAG: DUF3800 domain-containing protein [Burkholderiales bacterium]
MAAVISGGVMTYICYIDEAGCTTPLPGPQTDIQPVLAIVGLIVGATKIRNLTLAFLKLKRKYFPKKFGNGSHQLDDVLVEIKGSDLRSTIRKHGAHADATLKFIDATLDLLRANEARLFATVWIKGIGKPIDSRAIYTSSIQAACRNFSLFLDWHNDNGFMVADSRTPALNTQVSHSIFTQKYRAKGDPWERLLDLPAFGHSNNHVPLQIADILCSTLLFPMATTTYCAGQIIGKHVKGRDKLIKRRYASRIKSLQFRFKDAIGQQQGGIFVSDGLQGRKSDLLFQFSSLNANPPATTF